MLEDLKKLKYQGGKKELIYFLKDILGKNKLSINDIEILCEHIPGKFYTPVTNLYEYCITFGWIQLEDIYFFVSDEIADKLDNEEVLNDYLIKTTIKELFRNGIFKEDMFSFDSINKQYEFKNSNFPLGFSDIRNVLVSQGLFCITRTNSITKFYIEKNYEVVIAKYCKSKRKLFSLEILKKKLEQNEIAGEKAELFVLKYEKNRLGSPLCNSVKRISEIDASAGYDIISFNSIVSSEMDRYIEVKAISQSGFFWSKNEYDVAKLYGNNYFLYLVSLSQIEEKNYQPEIIRNPANEIFSNDRWLIETQSFRIAKIK